MQRYELSASQWHKIEGFLPGRPGSVGVTARDNRTFVNGVLCALFQFPYSAGRSFQRAPLRSTHKTPFTKVRVCLAVTPTEPGRDLGADLSDAAGRPR